MADCVKPSRAPGGSRTLRAVPDGEAPSKQAPTEQPKGISQAARDGSERELLVAIRDRIAETVERPDCPPRDLASLTKRLQDIRKEIAMLDAAARPAPAPQKHDDVDDKFDTSVI